jgi:hypothetical protein
MPIEVHCPNPECAKVHLVKDKYAGMRGKCPACSSWMYVPKAAAPTMQVSPLAAAEEAPWKPSEPAAPAQETPARASRRAAIEAEETLPIVKRKDRARPAVEVEEDDDKPVDVQPDAEKPQRKFSWLAALLLLLAMLSFGAIAATPFLEVGKANGTGDFALEYGERKFEGIREDYKLYVMAVPAGGAALVFLALLAGIVGRQFGFLSQFLVYLSALLAAAFVFLAVYIYRDQSHEIADILKRVEGLKQSQRKQGDVDPSLGQYLWVGLGGAAGASLFLILAAIVMHRRWWSRVLCFLFLGGVTALVVVWVYRKELGIEGIDQYIPGLS